MATHGWAWISIGHVEHEKLVAGLGIQHESHELHHLTIITTITVVIVIVIVRVMVIVILVVIPHHFSHRHHIPLSVLTRKHQHRPIHCDFILLAGCFDGHGKHVGYQQE